MASPGNAALCAMVATAFWTLLGFAVARHVVPRALALSAAPVLGWAVHSAVALPIFVLIRFSPIAVIGLAAICIVVSGWSILAHAALPETEAAPRVPVWAYAAAALLALAPAVTILPKISGDAVHLSDPVFDHSKIAIIDAMVRQGLPPINPIFGVSGAAGHIAYYYLWHFSAAEVALALGVNGWEADIGLTWFTALASLTLMMGLAVWLSKKSGAAIAVIVLAAAASLRAMLDWIFHSDLYPFLSYSNGFAGWLFQSSWVPQHLMSASCTVTAMLLIARCAQRQSVTLLLALALTIAAGFESSSYVGGVTFAIAAVAAAPLLFAGLDPGRRFRFAFGLAAAGVVVACLVAPFVIDQWAAVAARGDPMPIVIRPFEVLGEMFPPALRRTLDLAAYWLIELPIEFPASYVAGVIALLVLPRAMPSGLEKTALALLACLAAAGLVGSWLLASTVGDNNDLGLRAILPAAMILIVAAAAGIMCSSRSRAWIVATALIGLVLSLPDTAGMVRSNAVGRSTPDAMLFARSPALWDAVRHYAGPTERVANNPLFLQDLTPWPANMSWALLANRSSCFAGRELALAFAPLPAARREAINAQFVRVFNGEGTSEDVSEMATKYGCDVVVVVAEDKAWENDPFASSPDYRLAESRERQWRIYVRAGPSR
jgi:hypothetical protein